MAEKEINELTVTATTINNGSFLVIDQDLGAGVFQTQKLPKSVMQALVSNDNISNADMTLTEDRVVDGDSNSLTLSNMTNVNISAASDIVMSSGLGATATIGEGFEVSATTAVDISTDDSSTLSGIAGVVILSSNGNINITASGAGRNIILTTNANGAIVLGSSADPETDILTPLDGMVKYSTSLGKAVFREDGVWNSFKTDTHFGGRMELTTEVSTPLTMNTQTDVLGSFTGVDLTSFSAVSRSLECDSVATKNYYLFVNASISCSVHDNIKVSAIISDGSNDTVVFEQIKTGFNVGSSSVRAYFNFSKRVSVGLDQTIRLQFTNTSSSDDATMLLGSYFDLVEI